MTFKPYRKLIIVPRPDPFTVIAVEYYAPGCWRALLRVGCGKSHHAARAIAWKWAAEHKGVTVE